MTSFLLTTSIPLFVFLYYAYTDIIAANLLFSRLFRHIRPSLQKTESRPFTRASASEVSFISLLHVPGEGNLHEIFKEDGHVDLGFHLDFLVHVRPRPEEG